MPPPEHPVGPDSPRLAEIVRRHQAEAMVGTARLIASFPESDERYVEARRQITMAQVEFAVGRLTAQERSTVLAILRPCCPDLFARRTPPPLEFTGIEPHLGDFS